MTRAAIACLVLLPAGCGYGGPGPAESVAAADVVGRWRGAGCIEGALGEEVELVLRANGAYSFRRLDEGVGKASSGGTWALVGSSIELTGGEWQGYASTYVVGGRSPAGFLLFGAVEGCRDPDSFEVLRWSPLLPGE